MLDKQICIQANVTQIALNGTPSAHGLNSDSMSAKYQLSGDNEKEKAVRRSRHATEMVRERASELSYHNVSYEAMFVLTP
jgi:hypothetical protein